MVKAEQAYGTLRGHDKEREFECGQLVWEDNRRVTRGEVASSMYLPASRLWYWGAEGFLDIV